MEYYDSHLHCLMNQTGGILIGLEGGNLYDGTLSNEKVQKTIKKNNYLIGAYYVTEKFQPIDNETVLKYHPRREHYSADQVIRDLEKRHCKLCIIDTLNQPFWQPLDYWKIVARFPNILFILPHMGGYDIVDFIKILDFNSNVYADFSMTQEYFGWCGTRARLPIVADSIDYCLTAEKFRKRILFGSDAPFFSQSVALEKYCQYPHDKEILVDNFIDLINKIS